MNLWRGYPDEKTIKRANTSNRGASRIHLEGRGKKREVKLVPFKDNTEVGA